MTRCATECVTECDLGKLQAERSAYSSTAMMTGCQGRTCNQGRAKCREDCLLQEMAVVGDEAADASKAEGQAMWAVVLLLLCVFGAFAAGAYGIALMVG